MARIYLNPPQMGKHEKCLVDQVFHENWLAPAGPFIDQFEKDFCAVTSYTHAAAVASGTAALHLVLDHLNVGMGDLVLCPSLTFIGSIGPAFHRGAKVVFVDCDPNTWVLTEEILRETLLQLNKTRKLPKIVISVDLFGQCCQIDKLKKCCDEFGIVLISDSAEAMGSRFFDSKKGKEVYAGTGADASIFSFNGNKIITTAGGGMIASENAELVAHCRKLSSQAREDFPWYEHNELGYNFRLSSPLAAIGIGQLRVLEERVTRKREIFDFYQQHLSDLPGVSFMPEAPSCYTNRWLTVMQIEPEKSNGISAENISLALAKKEIESRPIWKPLHMQPVFCKGQVSEQVEKIDASLPICERLFANGLCLPSGGALTNAQLEEIVSCIRNCFSGRRLQ